MLRCRTCGAPLEAKARICGSCGAPTGVGPSPEPKLGVFSFIAAVAVASVALLILRWIGLLP